MTSFLTNRRTFSLFAHVGFPSKLLESEPTRHSARKASPLPRPPTSSAASCPERTSPSHAPSLEGEPAASGPTHHIEQHLRTDIHAAAALHWEATALLCKHLARVNQIFTAVVSCSFFRITQCLVGFSDILESLRCTLVLRVLVRVMHNRQFPVRFLDLVIIGVLLHSKNLIVVLPFRLLQLELGVSDFLCNTRLVRVRFGNVFVLADGGLPVTRFAEGAGFGLACFDIGRIEGQGAGAV